MGINAPPKNLEYKGNSSSLVLHTPTGFHSTLNESLVISSNLRTLYTWPNDMSCVPRDVNLPLTDPNIHRLCCHLNTDTPSCTHAIHRRTGHFSFHNHQVSRIMKLFLTCSPSLSHLERTKHLQFSLFILLLRVFLVVKLPP